ncbi:hypothetical protein [Sulfurospirillum tamanense]|nr:hypothetical protein [Sulfurospirillum tamanensis]
MKWVLTLIVVALFSGCAAKNEQYKDFKRSPCACVEKAVGHA